MSKLNGNDSELQPLFKPQDIPVQRTLTEEMLSEYLRQINNEELTQLADTIGSILMNVLATCFIAF